jgi:small subunit ribosomal protein S17
MERTEAGGGKRTPILVTGIVVSDKMEKTVRVERTVLVRHPKYEKFLRQRRSYVAHDERGEAHEGDEVEIAFTRPLSKSKRWRVVRVVRPRAVHRVAPEVLAAPVTGAAASADTGTRP